jgi:RNA polymerase sigma factor (sigma-70 family)
MTAHNCKLFPQLCRVGLRHDGAGLTDGELLECFVRGRDEAAFAALVQRHGPMVWSVCRRLLTSHHDAEDAFQATFLVLVRKAGAIASRELLANWLHGVAHRSALQARTAAAKRRLRERQVSELPEAAARPYAPDDDLSPVLARELGGLPDKYRVAIVLCDLEGKTRAEAARQLGWPEGTVAGRLARARALLGRRLARRGIVLPSAALATALARETAVAGVPAPLIASTKKAAMALAAGPATAVGALSAPVAALTEGVLHAMLLPKLKVAMALVVIAAIVSAGVVGVAHHQLLAAGPQQESSPKTESAPRGGAALAGTGQILKKPEESAKDAYLKAKLLQTELDMRLREYEVLRRKLAEYQAREASDREDRLQALHQDAAKLRDLLLVQDRDKVKLQVEMEFLREELAKWKARYVKLEEDNLVLKERLHALERQVQDSGQRAQNKKPVAPRLHGSVLEVSPEGYVKISVGRDDGIKEGQKLQVYRTQPAPVYLGTITVVVAYSRQAIARSSNAKDLRPQDQVTEIPTSEQGAVR